MTCAISNPPMERKNYVFVDYENVQDIDLGLVAGRPVKVFLVVSHHQSKMPMKLACQAHTHHSQVTWIESQGASKDALDLVLAFHVGRQVQLEPRGYFHVVSKDKGYDALIQHLRAAGILASRAAHFSTIPILADVSKLSPQDRLDHAIGCLRRNASCRPVKRRTLMTTLHAAFWKQLPEAEVEEVLVAMAARKLIEISTLGAVSYRF